MASSLLSVAPVLSTPDSHVLDQPSLVPNANGSPRISDERLYLTYEIQRTIFEIRAGRWRRIALQFPDEMLLDAPRVCWALSHGLRSTPLLPLRDADHLSRIAGSGKPPHFGYGQGLKGSNGNGHEHEGSKQEVAHEGEEAWEDEQVEVFILGDTSYGSCCVDEIAAEHVEADVVVHYGRSCLSPTSRLPVIYVFTSPPLDVPQVVEALKATYKDRSEQVLLMADVPYCSYMPVLEEALRRDGYTNVFATEIVQDPSSPLPNRTVPEEVRLDRARLAAYRLFHVAEPPTALLLILTSRVLDIHVYAVGSTGNAKAATATRMSTAHLLRRRYAIVTSLSTTTIWGILINTLSVKNYLDIVDYVKARIAAAGRKSYTFVVGKINAAKVANFAEIGGWVVIGCWESSLVDSRDFYKPLITPFELGIALKMDRERIWTGEWESDFHNLLAKNSSDEAGNEVFRSVDNEILKAPAELEEDLVETDDESTPPEFDLRTGRYVSYARPVELARDGSERASNTASGTGSVGATIAKGSTALTKQSNRQLNQVGGVHSPAAEYLRTHRTWQGLGSDLEVDFTKSGREGTLVEEGRSGLARGYTVGSANDEDRH